MFGGGDAEKTLRKSKNPLGAGHKKPVGMRLRGKLEKIDDLEQTFTMQITIYCEWKGPDLGHSKVKKIKVEDCKFTPEIFWIDAMEENEVESSYFNRDEHYYGLFSWIVTFTDNFRLERFPFDRQLINVAFFCTNCEIVEYEMSHGKFEDVPSDHAIEITYAYDSWVIERVVSICEGHEKEDPSLSRLRATTYVTRVPDFYMSNVVFISCLIVLCACSVRGVPPGEFADRMSVTMTLLLTSVAFKLVTSEWVPKISYQTLLDYYNLICILVLMLIVSENLIVALMVTYDTAPYDDLDTHDQYFFEVLVVVWFVFNMIIYMGYRYHLFYPHWENVVRANMLSDEKQCLRVPKLTGNVREETVDSTHYAKGNKHHLEFPKDDHMIWDTKTKTFIKDPKSAVYVEDRISEIKGSVSGGGSGGGSGSGVQMKEM